MDTFIMPPIVKNEEDSLRKAGFEFEFASLPLKKAVEILKNEFNLTAEKKNEYLYNFEGKHGKFVLELDFELLTKQELSQKAKDFFGQVGIEVQEKHIQKLESFLAELSEDVVPYELSTPPIPFDDLDFVEELSRILAEHGAVGTQVKSYYAFGLHINVELPSLDTKTIVNYLRAYLVLEDFLNKDAKLDVARVISPFIDSFPKKYTKLLISDSYNPSQKELIKDYLKYNPTRNRSLDMLPILAFLDKEEIREALPKEKIKPRPAFHYRLSNSSIGQKDWQVAHEWNRWVYVEKLANDTEALAELCQIYKKHLDNLINLQTWDAKVRAWAEAKKCV